MRGYVAWHRSFTPQANAEARRHYEQAVALDDSNADAHAALGGTYIDAAQYRTGDWEADLAAGERELARAIAIDPRHVAAHYWRGIALGLRWRFEEALLEFSPVVASNREAGRGLGRRGQIWLWMGRPAEAVADLEEAKRLSPREPNLASWNTRLGVASLMLGREEEALAHFMHAVAVSHGDDGMTLNLGSTYALLGRVEEARATLAELRARRPEVTIGYLRPLYMASSPDPLWRATSERRLEGLRLAGLPEE